MFLLHWAPVSDTFARPLYRDASWSTIANLRRVLNVVAIVAAVIAATVAPSSWPLWVSAAGVSVALWAKTLRSAATPSKWPRRYRMATSVGAVNWLLNVPAETATQRWCVVLLNIVATAALMLGIVVADPLERAWGCYRNTAIADLTLGMCASHFNLCPDQPSECPDFSKPACGTDTSRADCGVPAVNGEAASELEPYVTVGIAAAIASIIVYGMQAVGPKEKRH